VGFAVPPDDFEDDVQPAARLSHSAAASAMSTGTGNLHPGRPARRVTDRPARPVRGPRRPAARSPTFRFPSRATRFRTGKWSDWRGSGHLASGERVAPRVAPRVASPGAFRPRTVPLPGRDGQILVADVVGSAGECTGPGSALGGRSGRPVRLI